MCVCVLQQRASVEQPTEAELAVEAIVGVAEVAAKPPAVEEEPAALTRSMRPRRAGALSPPLPAVCLCTYCT